GGRCSPCTARPTGLSVRSCSPTRRRRTSGCCARPSRRQRPEPESAVVFVAGRDGGKRLAGGARRELDVPRLRERLAKKLLEAAQAGERERERSGRLRTRAAHDSSGPRREAAERPRGTTLGATSEMRKVTRDPEELELEGDAERIEL